LRHSAPLPHRLWRKLETRPITSLSKQAPGASSAGLWLYGNNRPMLRNRKGRGASETSWSGVQ
jgi:hypothetical protein